MDVDINKKINRLNELYSKSEYGNALEPAELSEQGLLREEMIEYFRLALLKREKGKNIKS